MKIKSLLLICSLAFTPALFAANQHIHPQSKNEASKLAKSARMAPGYCEIEIINESYDSLTVHGTFDDGFSLEFNIYRYEAPHYIDLYYDGYCHQGMYLEIYTPLFPVYSGYTRVGSTVRIVPYLNSQAKASISIK